MSLMDPSPAAAAKLVGWIVTVMGVILLFQGYAPGIAVGIILTLIGLWLAGAHRLMEFLAPKKPRF